jgi:hypothetical protein
MSSRANSDMDEFTHHEEADIQRHSQSSVSAVCWKPVCPRIYLNKENILILLYTPICEIDRMVNMDLSFSSTDHACVNGQLPLTQCMPPYGYATFFHWKYI